MEEQKVITILGSTGSIGRQALDVLSLHHNEYKIGYLTAHSNIDLLIEQVQKYSPKGIVVSDDTQYLKIKQLITNNCKILKGKEGLIEAASNAENTMVLSALVGFSGVEPTLAAINAGKTIALANKETLVSAGYNIIKAAKANNVRIIAVDSEHSAVLQCLVGEELNSIEKIILTASGGPFLNTDNSNFEKLTVKEALSHPNWTMGNKITIDSATLMNKGFEVIEAFWLFDVSLEKIEVLIHPQSIVHSLVQFYDGSVKAQLGVPDMKIPISYALSYPKRLKNKFRRLDLIEINNLTFFKPDESKFPCLRLAYEAMRRGGTATTILNAANEMAVIAFLEQKIRFSDIPIIIEKALETFPIKNNSDINEIIEIDRQVRDNCLFFIKPNK